MTVEEENFDLPKLTQAELNVIIRKHVMFMTGKSGGARAVIRDKDLSGLTFLGQNLSQSDFTGCIMANTDLANANFECSTLFGCDFTGAKLSNTRLVRADMRGTEVGEADLTKADLTGADLREGKTLLKRKVKKTEDQFSGIGTGGVTQFGGSDLTGANLNGATAISANFDDSILINASMQGTNLKNASLKGAEMSNVDLSNADIRNADFSYATMVGANIDGTEKAGSNFAYTLTAPPVEKDFAEFELTLDELILNHMSWIASGGRQGKRLDLTGKDMRQAPALSEKKLTAIRAIQTTFAEMDMRGIEMQSAQLDKSDFRKCLFQTADMRGSSFKEAILHRTDFSKANLNPLTFKKPDGVIYQVPCNFNQASLRHAVFIGARLMDAVFTGADLTEVNFTSCDLRNADFSGATLSNTLFESAILDGAIFDPK